jgi:hypothetical protein
MSKYRASKYCEASPQRKPWKAWEPPVWTAFCSLKVWETAEK